MIKLDKDQYTSGLILCLTQFNYESLKIQIERNLIPLDDRPKYVSLLETIDQDICRYIDMFKDWGITQEMFEKETTITQDAIDILNDFNTPGRKYDNLLAYINDYVANRYALRN
ncbi:MAG: hypothetical protein HUJ61_03905 [Bacilli bacterium]|nr:hypothetical protein [Bacilli bacterium]